VSLSLGLTISILLRRVLAEGEMYELKVIFPCLILRKSSRSFLPSEEYKHQHQTFLPLNGKLPVSILYSKIPSAQTSADFPKYGVFVTISGGMYDGVPQNKFNRPLCLVLIENPKSMILIIFLFMMRIFSSLMSRWTMEFEWQ